MVKDYYLWIEIGANKYRLLQEDYFNRILDKCAETGVEAIILGTKDTSGFCIYNSNIAPHYGYFDEEFDKEKDYLALYVKMAHEKKLKIYAAIDVFSEGRRDKRSLLSPAITTPYWQTQLYGLDDKGNASIRPISDLSNIKTFDLIDDFSDIFVNPIREDVQEYELNIIKEIAINYNVDGIVLDRVRFIGLAADFSDYTKSKFEEYIGEKITNWPEEVYILKIEDNKKNIIYGRLFGKWITFRALIIKDFIVKVRKLIDNLDKKVELLNYTGSWYPLYYEVGANWASENYIPEEYPCVGEEYSKTGYAEYLNKLLCGLYYPDITIEEAIKNNKPAFWYSVEGAAQIANKVVMGVIPVIGSLFVKQYEGNPTKFKKAVEMCFEKTQGCMIFDLSYIDDYNWWDILKI